jgi:hypothetical protein
MGRFPIDDLAYLMVNECQACGAKSGQRCKRADNLFVCPGRNRAPAIKPPPAHKKKAKKKLKRKRKLPPEPTKFWRCSFFLPLEPRGKAKVIPRKGSAEHEGKVIELARPHAPPVPLLGDVFMDVCFVLGNNRRVDRGNLLKLIEDALEKAGFFGDDSQIMDGPVAKRVAGEGEPSGYMVVVSGQLPIP